MPERQQLSGSPIAKAEHVAKGILGASENYAQRPQFLRLSQGRTCVAQNHYKHLVDFIADVLSYTLAAKGLSMSKNSNFLQKALHRAHPQLAGHQAKNSRKREIAIKLRALRDKRGMSQEEIAAAAGMTQSVIARLESLSGSIPSLGSIERYVDACDGDLALLISDRKLDKQDTFNDAFVRARGRVSSDIDLDGE